ncbi:MAG: glutathione synthase [Deltaproteobacteria bacterium]|jgi:glutathione synthase|nr:glutathione synthase [Deltaproteobacteria bacterium]MBW1969681.1 glutathione synthase [Deltaproteobacteria bacterium]MBW2156835.1 glutathione synthase [Deltaproteobacteria bacterium]MBW2197757.1 glutathione synthase [Deltaproteobacteria bacterium]MBW2227539.1 glutathione synthase [Deltaproteobacteria bacterium]
MKIAFLMDRLEPIDPMKETTSHLMYECNQRGHTVYFLEPHDIYIRGYEVVARMRNITVPPDLTMKKYWRSAIKCLKKDDLIFETVTELDALFLRKNPPLNYQAMEFLSPVNDRVFMINSTNGQILGNSKLYALNFPGIIPMTHVSRDPKRLKKIIDDFGGAMVIKPLQRYGGEGVIKVSIRDQENLNSLINYYVKGYEDYPAREPIMVQEFLEGVKKDGDIRILLLNGEILGAMRRKPMKGDFRTNVHAGARVFKHNVTKKEKEICRVIQDRLIKDGLYFVGIDVIGDKLVEINCVSPGGIARINKLDRVKLEAKVIDFVERKVKEMKGKND